MATSRLTPGPRGAGLSALQDVNVPLSAHLLEDLRPDGDAHLSQVGLPEQEHGGAGLPDAAADAQGKLVLQDALVIKELEKVQLAGQLQLLPEGLCVHPDS